MVISLAFAIVSANASAATGPNPWKVAMILSELKVPYKTEFLTFPELKKEPYERICVNGYVFHTSIASPRA